MTKAACGCFIPTLIFLGGRGVGGMAGGAMIKSNADNWKRLAVAGGWDGVHTSGYYRVFCEN